MVKYLAATVYRTMLELNSYLTYIRLRIKPFNKIDSRFAGLGNLKAGLNAVRNARKAKLERAKLIASDRLHTDYVVGSSPPIFLNQVSGKGGEGKHPYPNSSYPYRHGNSSFLIKIDSNRQDSW